MPYFREGSIDSVRTKRYDGGMNTTIYTTTSVASARGVTPTSVARMARSLGIGLRVGRDWIFTPAEAKLLKRRLQDGPGNPDFSKKRGRMKPKNRKKTR